MPSSRVRRRAATPVGVPGPASPPRPPAVVLTNLARAFGGRWAVAGVDLVVPTGAFFGLVGPNGAGKTTTLRMVTGLLRPSSGSAVVAGHDVWREPLAAKAAIGTLSEDGRTFDRLSGRELLAYTGLLRRLDRDVIDARAADLLTVLGLRADADKLVVDYSQGMRKKIGLACALLHAPRVVFLDEPFESVDPVSAATIAALLRRYADDGGTVVLSSHVMDVVERLCDHLAVMNGGRVVAAGTTEDVRSGRPLEERFFELVGARPDISGGLEWLSSSSA